MSDTDQLDNPVNLDYYENIEEMESVETTADYISGHLQEGSINGATEHLDQLATDPNGRRPLRSLLWVHL